MMIVSNRLTALFENESANPVIRTEAQRGASRRNGSHSRGPITALGKGKCRLNALSHGVFARAICPPADVSGSDATYRQIRRELMAEFKSARFSDIALIDSLAREYLTLVRIAAMEESLHRPPGLTDEDLEKWQSIVEHRQLIELLDSVLFKLSRGKPSCSRAQADLVVPRTAGAITKIEEALAAIAEDNAKIVAAEITEAEDPNQAREDAHWLELGSVVNAPGLQLRDRDVMARVLRGQVRLSEADRQRLITLLGHIRTNIDLKIFCERQEELRIKRLQDAHVSGLAEAPDRLLLLLRYRGKVENAIARKLKYLRGE
jgi:hypothetical protein